MPFSLIQFPIWEYFKSSWGDYVQRNVYPYEGALCGAAAGSISAAITTPFDVAKTRIMTNLQQSSKLSVKNVLLSVYKTKGIGG